MISGRRGGHMGLAALTCFQLLKLNKVKNALTSFLLNCFQGAIVVTFTGMLSDGQQEVAHETFLLGYIYTMS